MSMQTTIVVGASRGFGRAISENLASKGHRVIAVARNTEALSALQEGSENISVEVADASDPTASARLMAQWNPDNVILAAGAQPVMRPLSAYDWESFERPFQTDAKMTFHWLRDALLQPMKTGGRIVVFSSGAALHGSFLSGGYAPAKQAQRYLTNYARQEAKERKLELTLHTLLPQLNPNTRLGAAGVAAYAAKAGETTEQFVRKRFGNPLTPEIAAQAVTSVLNGEHDEHGELMLVGKGLIPVPS